MSNLNYSIFYKAKFTLASTADDDNMLWEFVKCIHHWQTKKWNKDGVIVLDGNYAAWTRLKNGGRLFSANGSERPVYIESEFFSPKNNPTQRFWACKISEKKSKGPGYCERDWVTEIGFRQVEAGVAEFSCVISYGDTPEFIGLYEETPAPTLPGLINALIFSKKFKCYAGADNITNIATELQVGDFPSFLEALTNPDRTISYIYISPRKLVSESDDTELLLCPRKLAKVVCGNAKVFFSKSIPFTQEMSYLFPSKEFCCYGGSIRVYKPGLNERDPEDAYRHRSLHPTFLEEVGEEETLRIYRRALAQNVNFYESFFGMKQCQEMRAEEFRENRLAEIRVKHAKEIGALQDTKLDEAIEAETKSLLAEARIAALETDLAEASAKKHSYEVQIDAMKATVARASALESAAQSRFEIDKYPQSPDAIVNYFTTAFADRICFSDAGIKSLKTCKLTSKDLWNVLYNLSTVMWALMRSDNCPDPYTEFKHQTGIDASRSEGKMTRKDSRLMEQFQTSYQGRTIDIEPHITFARESQSIHFGFDTETGRIVVGHCGKHLDIYSTQKHK